MLEKKTVLDQIEITRDGTVRFRIGLLIMDGDVEVDSKWHRSQVEPGLDVDAQASAVNAHLASMGRDPLSDDAIGRIKSHAKLAWTSDVISAFEVKSAALAAQAKPQG